MISPDQRVLIMDGVLDHPSLEACGLSEQSFDINRTKEIAVSIPAPFT